MTQTQKISRLGVNRYTVTVLFLFLGVHFLNCQISDDFKNLLELVIASNEVPLDLVENDSCFIVFNDEIGTQIAMDEVDPKWMTLHFVPLHRNAKRGYEVFVMVGDLAYRVSPGVFFEFIRITIEEDNLF